MNLNYPETINALNPAQRLYFYELFAHYLTVSMRGILFMEGIADSERVEQAKWLNEIAHRITYKIFYLQKDRYEWTESDTWEMIEKNVAKNPSIAEAVNAAIEMSYSYVLENESYESGNVYEQIA